MKKKHLLITTAALCSSISPILADDEGSLYFSLFGGGSILNDIDGSATGLEVEKDFDVGSNIAAAVGYEFAENKYGALRIELEVAYRNNDVDDLQFNTNDQDARGDLSSFSVMINAIHDFKTSSSFKPYVGVGVGFANIESDIQYGAVTIEDEDSVFSYQFIAGVEYAVTEKANIFVDYRLFGAVSSDLERISPAGPATLDVDDYINHSLNVGVRWKF